MLRKDDAMLDLNKAINDKRGDSDNNLNHGMKQIAQRVRDSHTETFADHPTKGKNLYKLNISAKGGDKAYSGIGVVHPDGSSSKIGRTSSGDTTLRRKNGMDHGVGTDHKLAKPIHQDEHDKLHSAIKEGNGKNADKLAAHKDLVNKTDALKAELKETHAKNAGLGHLKKKHIDQMVNKALQPKAVEPVNKSKAYFSYLKKSIDELFKGRMGGVDIGGSPDSKNTKTYEESFEKDDKPHPPGSAEDSAHDVAELDHSIAEEMKGLSSEEKKDMLAHLRTLKDKKKHRSTENKEAGSDMQKEESPAKKLLGRELTSDEHSKLKSWYETKGKSMLSPEQKDMISNIKREKYMKPKPSLN